MDELYLYDRDKGLFKKILAKSIVMQGRYHVSPNYGHDLNTTNLDSFLKDPKNGITEPEQKYPIVVCMPPASVINRENDTFDETFLFELFFLCKTHYNGQNRVKMEDKPTGRSGHHVWYDWKDMKEVAIEFLEALKQVQKKYRLKSFMAVDFSKVPIRRLSKYNNDNISGVGIKLEVQTANNLCELVDYNEDWIDDFDLPDELIHEHHKH
ncbi:MAG: hypothetical protein IPQ08_15460 [Chitinophagaceae bacterium]|nr:hypothetical protein [Chitinophagaceae bacterium]